jgi:aminoglycoside phosphotransferase (APT) family kinase protein
MTNVPWAADRPIDSHIVHAVVARQFPTFASSTVEYLDEGWDNIVFQVGSSWLFRFPKRADVEPSLHVERALLARLGPVLPLPVPRFEIFGEPSELFPRAFVGYRKLPGVTGDSVRPEAVPFLAERIADFLIALHSFPADEARRLGVPGGTDNRSFTRLHARVLDRFDIFRKAAPSLVDRAMRFVESPFPEPYTGEPRLLHADLGCGHVLVDGSEPSGIIDWADTEIGDPAVDLAGLYHWGGEPLFRAVLARYPFADTGLPARARFTATCLGFFDIFYGVGAGQPDCIELGGRALELNLPP